MNKKHNKYSPEWLNEIKKLVPKKNSTEKDKDGQVIDKTEIEILGEKRLELDNQITTLEQEIQTGKKSSDKAKNVYKAYKYLERRIAHIEDVANKTDFANRSSYFRNNATNAYGSGEGWNKLVKDHFEKDIATGTAYADNIYDIQLPNETNKREIVEEEIITVLGRVFEGLENINVDKFTTKYNVFDNNTTNQGHVKTWLENIQKEAKCLVKSKDEKMYDFGYTYRQHKGLGNAGDGALKNDGTTAPTNVRPIRALLVEFFNWLDLVNKENFLKTLTDDINTSQNISIRLKGNEISKAFLKDDYGIPLKDNQKLYWNGTATVNYYLQNGVKGWITLVGLVGTTGNRVKILESFNNAPNHDLFDNMMRTGNAWNENQKSWNYDGTRFASLEDMTDDNSINKGKEALDELAVQKDLEVQDVALTNREISKKRVEKTTKETERNNLDAKIQKLITDELVTRRNTLATYKITDGFEDKSSETNGQDNRRTSSDLQTIKEKLEEISYLENADTEMISSDNDENTAYSKLAELVKDFQNSKIFKFITAEGTTEADKCKKIKETSQDLESYKIDYEKWEKLIKFTGKQQAEFTAIKIALGQKENPAETLTTYLDKLKGLDANLASVFTEDLMKKWQQANNFKTAETLLALLESAKKDDKYDDFFAKIKTGSNYAEVKDVDGWTKLLVKEPKAVITVIKRWEFDKETSLSKNQKTVNLIKMNMNKKKTDNLGEEEITTGLYKLAVGEYSQKTEAEIKKWEEGETEENNQKPEASFFRVNNPWMWGGIGVITVAAIAVFYYFYSKSQGEEKTEEELAKGNDEKDEANDDRE